MSGAPPAPPPAAPPGSARRRPWTGAELAALDFETTGLDLAADSVVSWGVAPVSAGGVDLRDAVYRLVAPDRAPDATSIRIHELRPADLAAAPRPAEVVHTLREALDGRFVLAWAAGIEIAFLRRTFGGSERSWRRRTLDVRELMAAALPAEPDARRFNLERACRRFGVPVERTHHAFDDALMTAELFLVLAGRLGAGRASPPTVRDLARTARRGARMLRARPGTRVRPPGVRAGG